MSIANLRALTRNVIPAFKISAIVTLTRIPISLRLVHFYVSSSAISHIHLSSFIFTLLCQNVKHTYLANFHLSRTSYAPSSNSHQSTRRSSSQANPWSICLTPAFARQRLRASHSFICSDASRRRQRRRRRARRDVIHDASAPEGRGSQGIRECLLCCIVFASGEVCSGPLAA